MFDWFKRVLKLSGPDEDSTGGILPRQEQTPRGLIRSRLVPLLEARSETPTRSIDWPTGRVRNAVINSGCNMFGEVLEIPESVIRRWGAGLDKEGALYNFGKSSARELIGVLRDWRAANGKATDKD